MIRTWVIGSGGLLGGSIKGELIKKKQWHFTPSSPFLWNDPSALKQQFATQITQFFSHFESGDQWQIVWAAGKSTMRTPESVCLQETGMLKDFLLQLTQVLQTHSYAGRIGFASTAGAIYTQGQDSPISESCPTSPSTAYARQKLAQEALLMQWASECEACQRLIIGRFSTLYGLHQDQNKRQGLISAITKCISNSEPLSLFVPLETVRDYLWSDDAAILFLWHLNQEPPKNSDPIRLIAQEESISIAAMLEKFQLLTGKQVKVLYSPELPQGVYPLEIRFQSLHPITASLFKKLSLSQGIEKILANLP